MITFALLAALFGLLIGSFLNVCIHRWPRDLSVVRPRSACVSCSHQIAWFDNVPVLSFALLKGHCRHCSAPIHWRYPVVELLTALLLRLVRRPLRSKRRDREILRLLRTHDRPDFQRPGDADSTGRIHYRRHCDRAGASPPSYRFPDQTFALMGQIAGFQLGPRAASLGEAAFGAFVPSVTLWLLGWAFEKLRQKEGLGFGDVKMMDAVVAFIGFDGDLMTVILGSIAGSVMGLIFIKAAGKDAASFQLPFASFLGAAALVAAMRV